MRQKSCDYQGPFRRYVNEGHDVQNTQEFKTAILSNGGVTGVGVAVVDAAVAACELPQLKLDGVSMLNNFEFSSDAVTVWKTFDVGHGKQISKSEIHGKKKKKKSIME